MPRHGLAQWIVMALAGIGVLATGLVLRATALSPANAVSPETYSTLFMLHGQAFLAGIAIVLFCFAPMPERRAWLGPLLGCAIALFGSLSFLAAGLAAQRAGGWTAYSPYATDPTPTSALDVVRIVGASLALVATMAGGVAIAFARPRTVATAFFVVATVAQTFAWFATASRRSELAALAFFPTVLAVIVAPSLEAEARWRRPVVAAAAVYLGARTLVRVLGYSVFALVELPAGLAVAILVALGSRALPRRIEAMLFAQAVLLASYLGLVGDAGMHLHDTLVPVAALHLEGCVLVFAALRSLGDAGRAGVVVAGASAHAFCWSMAILGGRGNPRRYASYLDVFAPLHTAVSVAAFLVVVGLVLAIVVRDATKRVPS